MEELAERLGKDGFEVVDTDLVPMACNISLVKKHDYQGDYLVILGCDSGVLTIQSIFPNKMVVPGLNTIGLGARDVQGNIFLMKRF